MNVCGRTPACGLPHPRCSAHSKRTGRPCGAVPKTGQTVCRTHGGKSPQALAKAEERQIEAAATRALASMGVAVPTDPGQALLDLVAEAAGNVAFLRHQVQQLEQRASPTVVRTDEDGYSVETGGQTLAGPTGSTAKPFEAAPHVLVGMYESWCDRLAKYSEMALRAGVEERRVRLVEADAARMFTAIAAALNAAGLNPAQQEAFRVNLAAQLRPSGGAG